MSGKGHAFIDRALYLPTDWTKDPARMRAAHVPDGVGFATKPRLALDMIERAIGAGVPFSQVAADTVYGTGEVEMAPRRAGKGYVLGAGADAQFNSWVGKPEVYGTAEEIARTLDASTRRRLSAGEGTEGPRSYDWAYLEPADLDADEYDPTLGGTWTRGLLIRRDIADGGCAYFSTWCPVPVGLRRHPSGGALRDGPRPRCWSRSKGSAGPSKTRPRRPRPNRAWSGEPPVRRPRRDPLLARLASPRLAGHARLRHAGHRPPPRAKARFRPCEPGTAPEKGVTAAPDTPALVRWSVQEIRRVAARLAQRRIRPAYIIAWSLWRRAHQAAARRSHLKRKAQL